MLCPCYLCFKDKSSLLSGDGNGIIDVIANAYLRSEMRAILRGEFHNLPREYIVSNDLEQTDFDLFIHRRYSDRREGIIQYQWVVPSDHPLPSGTHLGRVGT
jgi:hypothetical protein